MKQQGVHIKTLLRTSPFRRRENTTFQIFWKHENRLPTGTHSRFSGQVKPHSPRFSGEGENTPPPDFLEM